MVWAVFSSDRVGTVIAARFRLDARIGTGGMGEVYRATHLDLGVPVAVKLLGPAIAGLEKAVTRFRREARAAARLKSAHIVQVYDFGVDGDVPFLVMELLDGESLSERLDREGRLAPSDAAHLVEQAARGLTVAHELGIVHRDVKPSNLFVARSPDGELIKLLDFGVAKPEESDAAITGSKEVVGSPLHMSPEQAHGEELDPRADVWALATVAFRMLTGADAFAGPTTSSVLVKICSSVAPRASAVAPGIPPEIDAFFEKAFARSIDARFQSAAELARAFASATGAARSAPAARDPAAGSSADFARSHATVAIAPLSSTPPPERRVPVRWTWVALAAVLLAASLGLVARRAVAPEPASSAAGSSSGQAPRAEPSPKAAASVAEVAKSPAPPVTEPSAASATSVTPARARSRRAPKPPAAPPPSASTAAPSSDTKRRDPLFGL